MRRLLLPFGMSLALATAGPELKTSNDALHNRQIEIAGGISEALAKPGKPGKSQKTPKPLEYLDGNVQIRFEKKDNERLVQAEAGEDVDITLQAAQKAFIEHVQAELIASQKGFWVDDFKVDLERTDKDSYVVRIGAILLPVSGFWQPHRYIAMRSDVVRKDALDAQATTKQKKKIVWEFQLIAAMPPQAVMQFYDAQDEAGELLLFAKLGAASPPFHWETDKR